MANKKRDKKSIFDEDENASVQSDTQPETQIEEGQAEFIEDKNDSDFDSVGEAFNPLHGEVKKREYAQNVGVSNVPEVERVPEPSINNLPPPPPPTSGGNSAFIGGESSPNPSSQPSGSSQPSSNSNKPQEPLNPDMAGLSPKEAKEASTMLVDAILQAYKMLWGFGYEYIAVKEQTIIEWVMSDEISADIKLPVGNNEELTLREVYEIFNSQAKDALIVNLQEDDFIKVREAMIREFTKRGWGISDMQYIMQHFIRDSITRGSAVYQLKGTINNFTNQMKKQHEDMKKLREELFEIKERVKQSEAEPIKKNTPKREVVQPKEVMKDVSDFIESYDVKKSGEPEIREVPNYEGNSDIAPIDPIVLPND